MNIVELLASQNQRILRLEKLICRLEDCCSTNSAGSGDEDKRFGVATEDFIATQDRQFDLDDHNFQFIGDTGSYIDLFLQDSGSSAYGELYVDPTQVYLSSGDGGIEGASVTVFPNEVQFNQNSGVYSFANLQVDDAAQYYLVENNGYVGKKLISPDCKIYGYLPIGSFATPSNISTVGSGSGDLSTMTQIVISDYIGVDDQTSWMGQLVSGNIVTITKVGDPSVSATMTLALDQNSDPNYRIYNVTLLSSTSYAFTGTEQFSICWEAPPQPFRFGAADEDDLATEVRDFDIDQYDFLIKSGWGNYQEFRMSPLNGANYMVVDNAGLANSHVNTSISPSNEALVEIHASSGFFSSTIRPDAADPSPGANMSIQSGYNDGGGNIRLHEVQVNYDGISIVGSGAGSFSGSNITDLRISSLPTATDYDRILVIDFADSNKIKLLNPAELTPVFTPANSTDNTYPNGTLAADDNFLYFRTSTGTWKKVALGAF